MPNQSPPKRPRLSLQIKALSAGPSIRTSRTLAAVVNPRSPTSFNTLSNVYSTAIDRSSVPVSATGEPVTAINTDTKRLPQLPRLQMPNALVSDRNAHTPYVTTQFPETPLTARPMSPAVAMDMAFPSTMTATPPLSAGPMDQGTAQAQVFCFSPDDIQRNSYNNSNNISSSSSSSLHYLRGGRAADLGIIVTPHESRHLDDDDLDTGITDTCSESSVTMSDTGLDTPFPTDLHVSPPPPTPRPLPQLQAPPQPQLQHQQPPMSSRRRTTAPAVMLPGRQAPYVHPRTLHSILRNSPLPPRTAISPISPRRQSQRLLEKASRHVMYHSPLTQTITTNLYTKSHIDLLCEEASPFASPSSASPSANDAETVLDLTLAYSGDETRDGGATPGPFEEMRRRMAGLGSSSSATNSASTSTATTPISPGSSLGGGHSSGGIRKRKQPRKDKKRRWVWTLGQDEEEEATLSGAMAALKAAQKAEETAAAKAAAESNAAAALAEAEADLKTPLAREANQAMALPQEKPVVAAVPQALSQDVDMQDLTTPTVTEVGRETQGSSESEEKVPATVEATTGTASNIAAKPPATRKRKSTPTPYATDSESDFGGDDDADVDMRTPSTALGTHLEGTWLLEAAAVGAVHAGLKRR